MATTAHNTASGNGLVLPYSFTGKEWCKSQWLAQRGLGKNGARPAKTVDFRVKIGKKRSKTEQWQTNP